MTVSFGTDGIRSTDTAWLCRTGYQLGRAQQGKSKVAVARDNRPTSDKIAAAVMAGLRDAEVDILYGGVMTTPALQYATVYCTADCGIMVTASHNPPLHNGLKYINADGRKPTQAEWEALWESMQTCRPQEVEYYAPVQDNLARAYPHKFDRYGQIPVCVAVDCANGAAYPTIKHILSMHGIEGTFVHHGNGKQINLGCGATHPDLPDEGFDLAFALDGDGDRCILKTKAGRLVDGDGILYLLAKYRHRHGNAPDALVSTIMANSALSARLHAMNVRLVRTEVGDSNVFGKMQACGCPLGGEPSGHILLEDGVSDGIQTGLMLMQIAAECDLDEMLSDWHPLPQCHTRCEATEDNLRRAKQAADKWQDYLADTGRIVVRPSGTENIIRIMVECQSEHLAKNVADSITLAAKGKQ